MTAATDPFTTLLQRSLNGNKASANELFPLVYQELRSLAHAQLRGEGEGHTLQTTALINETYLRLIGQNRTDWQTRSHFVAIAAQAMRRILIDHARRKLADKRPDPRQRVDFEFAEMIPLRDETLLALDRALSDLETLDPRQAKVVELKFFAGLDLDQIAKVLDVSAATVTREWRLAKGWLHMALTEG
ncbi:MAG: sigma-70 family RNA polymerase sigma factor [Xanthomonadales bacterium]|nr:sigma-70 family RNA polymerase sigma factor [Xanthomonadales bacterium]